MVLIVPFWWFVLALMIVMVGTVVVFLFRATIERPPEAPRRTILDRDPGEAELPSDRRRRLGRD